MNLLKKYSIFLLVLFVFGFSLSLPIDISVFTSQSYVSRLLPIVSVAQQALGFHGKKTFLILFQNNMELRPGGGFIGSYGLVSFNKGKMGELTIHNVYDADGQLRAHIEPHFIIRRFLQPHLYMRDSNFDVDFAKSASEAAFMLKEETGQHVDGLIAVDLSLLKSLLQSLGSVYVPGYSETVTANNFFLLTETHSDKNSFSGSTQKQNYLRALFSSIKEKLKTKGITEYPDLVKIAIKAIQEKHLLFWFADKKLENTLIVEKLSSSLYDQRKQTAGVINDFLGVNEANIGVNKANYFLQRSISQYVSINQSGTITEDVHVIYNNTSKPQVWPGGAYVAYVRFIVPQGAVLNGISINSVKQNIVLAVTDFWQYEAKGFVVPDGLEVDKAEEEGKTIYGFRIIVPIQTKQSVQISYTLEQHVDISSTHLQYDNYLYKQPGTDGDTYFLSLEYPKTYMVENVGGRNDSNNGQTEFLTHLTTDKNIIVNLKKSRTTL